MYGGIVEKSRLNTHTKDQLWKNLAFDFSET